MRNAALLREVVVNTGNISPLTSAKANLNAHNGLLDFMVLSHPLSMGA
jgi:hypothetical protein